MKKYILFIIGVIFTNILVVYSLENNKHKIHAVYNVDIYTSYGIYRMEVGKDYTISEENTDYKLTFDSEQKVKDYMEWITARDAIIRDSLPNGLYLNDPLSKSDTLLVSRTTNWVHKSNGDILPIRTSAGYVVYLGHQEFQPNTYKYYPNY
jgi:hypothetical protein